MSNAYVHPREERPGVVPVAPTLADGVQPALTPEEFAAQMREIFPGRHDYESAHCAADELMCIVLERLGYKAGVDIFNAAGKWYA